MVAFMSRYITLPAGNQARVAQLAVKLEEYRERLLFAHERLKGSIGYMAPEVLVEEYSQHPYRVFILERLLRDGKIDIWAVAKEMKKWMPKELDTDYFFPYFRRSCGVIEEYAKNGGQNLRGGTGLPKVPVMN